MQMPADLASQTPGLGWAHAFQRKLHREISVSLAASLVMCWADSVPGVAAGHARTRTPQTLNGSNNLISKARQASAQAKSTQ